MQIHRRMHSILTQSSITVSLLLPVSLQRKLCSCFTNVAHLMPPWKSTEEKKMNLRKILQFAIVKYKWNGRFLSAFRCYHTDYCDKLFVVSFVVWIAPLSNALVTQSIFRKKEIWYQIQSVWTQLSILLNEKVYKYSTSQKFRPTFSFKGMGSSVHALDWCCILPKNAVHDFKSLLLRLPESLLHYLENIKWESLQYISCYDYRCC